MSRATTRELSVEFPSTHVEGMKVGAAIDADSVSITMAEPGRDARFVTMSRADFRRLIGEHDRFAAMEAWS